MSSPQISVIMAVYNTKELYLREAIESILNQTFSDFEFIIIDDCSTDNSKNIIHEYEEKDNRIKVILNSQNLGLTKSLNIGIQVARGRYIARMDSDDISLPNRFKRQYEYMERNKDIAVLGAHAYQLGTKRIIMRRVFSKNLEITKIRMLFYDAGFVHPSVFIRKEFLDTNGILYDESMKKAQDYELWVRCLEYGKLALLPVPLLEYRIHEGQISTHSKKEQDYHSNIVKLRQLNHLCDHLTEEEIKIHLNCLNEEVKIEPTSLARYLEKLILENNRKNIYSKELFKRELEILWVHRMIKRIIKKRKTEMLWNKYTFKALSCRNSKYLVQYFLGNIVTE